MEFFNRYNSILAFRSCSYAAIIFPLTKLPLERILDAENLKLFKDGKTKILCCDDGRLSNSAWMILNQFGIRNLKVLDGGINALNAFLNSRDNNKDKPQGDEAIRFNLKKMTGSDSSSD